MNAKQLVLPVVVALAVLAGCDKEKKPDATTPTNTPSATTRPAPARSPVVAPTTQKTNATKSN
ncbi:MAG: hypothetical protein ACHRHE_14180 [Tepidisphaerales bacterium]